MRRLLTLAALCLVTSGVSASPLDAIVDRVLKVYGGEAAWKKVVALREEGQVNATMRNTIGTMTRQWIKPEVLRVTIVYPTSTEARVLDHGKGTRNGKEVSGMSLDAMRLQAGRLSLPLILSEWRDKLQDRGVEHGMRIIDVPLSGTMSLRVEVDPATGHIVKSTGSAPGPAGASIEFATEYQDFREVGGLLFAHTEKNFAQGVATATITLTRIEVNPSSK